VKKFGGEAMRDQLAKAPGFFDYYLNLLCLKNDITSDKGRVAVVRSMGEAVRKTGNMVILDQYAQKTAIRLGVQPDSTRSEFKKASSLRETSEPETETVAEPAFKKEVPAPEMWLLKILLLHEDLVEWTAAHLDLRWVQHEGVRDIVRKRIESYQDGTWRGIGSFLAGFESPEISGFITATAGEARKIHQPEKTLIGDAQKLGLIHLLRNEFLDRELDKIKNRLLQPDLSVQEQVDCLKQKDSLRKAKSFPLTPMGEM
jgi:hypothetical protein